MIMSRAPNSKSRERPFAVHARARSRLKRIIRRRRRHASGLKSEISNTSNQRFLALLRTSAPSSISPLCYNKQFVATFASVARDSVGCEMDEAAAWSEQEDAERVFGNPASSGSH